MEQARVNWNDDRLDHLSEQVDALRSRMEERFEKQDARIEARFDALQRSMILTLASLLAAFGGLFVSTQL